MDWTINIHPVKRLKPTTHIIFGRNCFLTLNKILYHPAYYRAEASILGYDALSSGSKLLLFRGKLLDVSSGSTQSKFRRTTAKAWIQDSGDRTTDP
jgi:hypothetical protein